MRHVCISALIKIFIFLILALFLLIHYLKFCLKLQASRKIYQPLLINKETRQIYTPLHINLIPNTHRGLIQKMKIKAWLFFFFFFILLKAFIPSHASENILTPGYNLMTRTRDRDVKNNNLDDTIIGSKREDDDKRYEEILRAKGSYGGSDVLHKRPKSSRAISLAAGHSCIPILSTGLGLHVIIGMLVLVFY